MKEVRSVRVETELVNKVKGYAEADERSIGWIMNKAIEEYVERRERKKKPKK